MADNFFNKLNTLVRAHVNNIVDPMDEDSRERRQKALSQKTIRGGLQKDVALLRQRVDDALQYEGELQNRVDKLYAELSDWDDKADKAVKEGREQDARYALSRMQQAQKDVQMTEADLQEHRIITQDLLQQVNRLEATVQAAEEAAAQTVDEDGNIEIPVNTGSTSSNSPSVDEIGSQIVQQLDKSRQHLSSLISDYTARVTGDTPPPSEPQNNQPSRPIPHPVDRRKVDDEYSARLSRLSKPDDK
ncbi:MAG: PspA/IM30 family protein [Chloroflexota bacterium]